jgi:hypothetical protein
MSRRAERRLFWAVVAALVLAHLDPWGGTDIEPVLFGWIPRDLAYPLGWVGLATAVTFWMCARIWRDDEE